MRRGRRGRQAVGGGGEAEGAGWAERFLFCPLAQPTAAGLVWEPLPNDLSDGEAGTREETLCVLLLGEIEGEGERGRGGEKEGLSIFSLPLLWNCDREEEKL